MAIAHSDLRASGTRLVHAVALVAALLLLIGCSSAAQPTASPSPSAPADPFVGTWRVDWADATFVISQDGGDYEALAAGPGIDTVATLAVVKQRGDSILFEVVTGETAGDTYRFTLTRDPTRLRLVAMEEGMTKPAHAVVNRVSDSTASPTPPSIE
jgi:hypothetical protein